MSKTQKIYKLQQFLINILLSKFVGQVIEINSVSIDIEIKKALSIDIKILI